MTIEEFRRLFEICHRNHHTPSFPHTFRNKELVVPRASLGTYSRSAKILAVGQRLDGRTSVEWGRKELGFPALEAEEDRDNYITFDETNCGDCAFFPDFTAPINE